MTATTRIRRRDHRLSDTATGIRPPSHRARNAPTIALAIALSTIYCLAFLVRPTASWPTLLKEVLSHPSRWTYGLIDDGLRLVGSEGHVTEIPATVYLVLVTGVIPWAVLALSGRGRPYDLGFRRPNRYGWRITLVGYLISVPFLIWMVRGEGFATPYLRELDRAGPTGFTLYYVVNMLGEHFFFHGALLAAFRAGQRWPPPAPVAVDATDTLSSAMQWIGLVHPTSGAKGVRRVIRWTGLPDGCLPAIVASATLFGLIHVGKDPRELVLSIPGGVALGYMAYRTDTWLTPFVLHLATAGTACLMIVASR